MNQTKKTLLAWFVPAAIAGMLIVALAIPAAHAEPPPPPAVVVAPITNSKPLMATSGLALAKVCPVAEERLAELVRTARGKTGEVARAQIAQAGLISELALKAGCSSVRLLAGVVGVKANGEDVDAKGSK